MRSNPKLEETIKGMACPDIQERINEILKCLGEDKYFVGQAALEEYFNPPANPSDCERERYQLVEELVRLDAELADRDVLQSNYFLSSYNLTFENDERPFSPDDPYTFVEGLYEYLCEMPAKEKVTISGYMDKIIELEITKDPDFKYSSVIEDEETEFNMVTVDFVINGKSLATTSDIHVQDLEQVLNEIKGGKTDYLIDEQKSLADILKEYKEIHKDEEIEKD